MTKKQLALAAVDKLKQIYPDAVCTLEYRDPFQLLVSVRLAAQCTDARVNLVTPALFERFPDIGAFADADPSEVEPYIFSTGFYKIKSRDLVKLARTLRDNYGGRVPDTVEELIKLPGVGRKTANLICGDVYGVPGVVVADTHCIRISRRLGLTEGDDPLKTEMQLRKLLPPEESNNFCHRLVLFGRETCMARSPKCGVCPLAGICRKNL